MGLGTFLGIGGTAASAALSARQAKKQREFQKDMYQHRYQYQMDDMRKAGLNPILAYKQTPPGGPGGAMGQVGDFGDTINTSRKTSAEVKLKGKQTILARNQIRLMAGQTAKAEAEARNIDTQTRMMGWKEPGAVLGGWVAKGMRGLEKAFTAKDQTWRPGRAPRRAKGGKTKYKGSLKQLQRDFSSEAVNARQRARGNVGYKSGSSGRR